MKAGHACPLHCSARSGEALAALGAQDASVEGRPAEPVLAAGEGLRSCRGHGHRPCQHSTSAKASPAHSWAPTWSLLLSLSHPLAHPEDRFSYPITSRHPLCHNHTMITITVTMTKGVIVRSLGLSCCHRPSLSPLCHLIGTITHSDNHMRLHNYHTW